MQTYYQKYIQENKDRILAQRQEYLAKKRLQRIEKNAKRSKSELNKLCPNWNDIKKDLPERWANIVEMRHGFFDNHCYSYAEIGDRYSITRQAAYQTYSKAISKIKKMV